MEHSWNKRGKEKATAGLSIDRVDLPRFQFGLLASLPSVSFYQLKLKGRLELGLGYLDTLFKMGLTLEKCSLEIFEPRASVVN